MQNQGYTILERCTTGSRGFVLGHNPNAPLQYVTWQYRADAPENYFWGHYLESKAAAYDDYYRRIGRSTQINTHADGRGGRVR